MEMKKTMKKWTVPEFKKSPGFVTDRLPKASRVHAVLWLGGGLLELRSAGVVWFGSPQLTWQTTYAVLHSASLSREKSHVRSRSLCDELEEMSVDSRLGHWKVAGCMGFDGLVDPVSPSLHVDSVGLLRIWFCSVHSEGFPACRLDDAQAQMLG
jgi:hypothetical protein